MLSKIAIALAVSGVNAISIQKVKEVKEEVEYDCEDCQGVKTVEECDAMSFKVVVKNCKKYCTKNKVCDPDATASASFLQKIARVKTAAMPEEWCEKNQGMQDAAKDIATAMESPDDPAAATEWVTAMQKYCLINNEEATNGFVVQCVREWPLEKKPWIETTIAGLNDPLCTGV